MIAWIARLTTTRRGPVLATLAVLAVVLGTQIPNIRVDPSVESLISSYEGGDNVAERFKETFGDSSRTMVLLVQADDVFAQPVLQYVHDLSGALEGLDFVESVVSLTRTPLPRRVEADPDAALDALDDLDSLDDLEEEYDELDEGETDDGYDPAVVDALVELVEADPARFPGGFQVLGPSLSLELEATPIVEGDEVTPEDVTELRNTLRQTDLLEGRLVSQDHTLVVTAMVLADGDSRETRERVSSLRQLLEDHAPPTGAHARLGGLPYMRSVIVENIRSDQIFLVPMTLVVCMLLLAVFLRWFAGVVLPIAAVAITAVMVVGGMAVAGEPFNILNNIIPTLLIIIGISDSIHIIGRYREELVAGDGAIAAGVRTVEHMAVACLLTSVTTAVGLASLVVSKTAMLRHFGTTAAVGVMVAYVVTITFLPAVLTWLRPPKAAPVREQSSGTLENAIEAMTRKLIARPWLVLFMAAALMGVTGYQATQLVVDHALLDQFDEEDPVYITTRLLEEKLDGVRPFEISLSSDQEGRFNDAELLGKLDEVLAWANERPEVLSTMSPMRLMRHTLALLSRDETARDESLASDEVVLALSHLLSARGEDDDPLKTWVSPDRRHLRLQLKVRDVGAQDTMALADDLQTRLTAVLPPDVNVGFTGEAYDGSAGMDAVVTDLLSSLMLAVAIIFVLLTLLFRSLRLGLLSIPPNLIPLVFTMAYMVWRDIPLNAATVIIFSISLGLAVDGTIHVLARFREETIEKGRPPHEALVLAARGTGRAIVVSCLTLMAGFSVLLFSNFVPVQRFGELIAVTVACTLFATLIVQPALLFVAGTKRTPKSKPEA